MEITKASYVGDGNFSVAVSHEPRVDTSAVEAYVEQVVHDVHEPVMATFPIEGPNGTRYVQARRRPLANRRSRRRNDCP